MIAHGLDTLLKLLHPMMPFVTESIWEFLGQMAPVRGVPTPASCSPLLMTADWPESIASHHDETIEQQFAEFQQVVGAIRQIRASQNIAPRETVPVAIACSGDSASRLEPMRSSLEKLASCELISLGTDTKPFETNAPLSLAAIDMEVHVDLGKFIDLDAELSRLEKLLDQLTKQITGKASKLGNENFVSRAPAEVVEKERESLTDLKRQKESVQGDIQRLQAKAG